MSKLHAQMALFGTIDDVLRETDNVEIVQTVEEFMPGFTGFGKRGWFGELKVFLARPELAPETPPSEPRTPDTMFPPLVEAINDLEVPPEPEPSSDPPGSDDQTPTDVLRTLFASTLLSKLRSIVIANGDDPPPGLNFADEDDPLTKLLPQRVEMPPGGSESIPGLDPIETEDDLVPAVRKYLIECEDLAQFQTRMTTLADHGIIKKAVAEGKTLCTGGLRKINGKYCSVLTTDYERSNLSVADIKRVMEPHNWPKLCPSFFREINDQNPALARGWTRVLEVVSADPTLWELRTALRYWKGETTPGGGFYINYDLDWIRTGDGKLVEVDAGYILITPLDPTKPNDGVRIRTSKQVRIRGMSSTASAVLACFMGWGDVSTRMLTDRAKPPFVGAVDFGNVSQETLGPQIGGTAIVDEPTDEEIEQAAEDTELPPRWRGALISGFQKELTEFIGVATVGASNFYKRYSDGMTTEDVKEFGAQFGKDLTNYAAGLLNAATNATTKPDPSKPSGGV